MSFIVRARLITRGCRSQFLSFNLNSVNRKISTQNNYFKISAPWAQKRWSSDEKQMKTNTDNDIEKIYTGTLTTKIKLVKLLSLTSSLGTLAVQPYIIPKLMESGNLAAPISLGFILSFFTFVSPILLHMITNKYIIAIHYDNRTRKYIATTYTFFARQKKIEFTPDDVEKPGLAEMLSNCYIKGRSLFMDSENFTDPKHYAIIMGYDKPIDFRFEAAIHAKDVHHEECKQANRMNEKKSIRN